MTSDATKLVSELRDTSCSFCDGHALMGKAASFIEAQQRAVETLREALKPFAKFSGGYSDPDLAVTIELNVQPHPSMTLPLSAFFAATAALSSTEPKVK